ncbi:MAG: YmdB family metallophosphoesterase, partial [Armatimonadota bacterium]
MRVIFIGDIVGRPGRRAVRDLVPDLRGRFEASFVVANCENAAGGLGV